MVAHCFKVGTHEGTCCGDTNSMHCLHEGTCSGDKFLEVFTGRNLLQGLAKWPFLIGLFWYCRGDMLHEQFTWGDNCIFCCFVAATCPLNSNWFEFRGHVSATKFCPHDKIFSWKLIVHTRRHVAGTCQGDMSPGHVPSCVPTFRELGVTISHDPLLQLAYY